MTKIEHGWFEIVNLGENHLWMASVGNLKNFLATMLPALSNIGGAEKKIWIWTSQSWKKGLKKYIATFYFRYMVKDMEQMFQLFHLN